MQRYASGLRRIAPVTPFDYPYMAEGRKAPDRLPTLVAAHAERFERFRKRNRRVVFVGKSMGSRVGCHVAAERDLDLGPIGLVCFGYPLVGASKRKPVRDEVLIALQTPILFVQGTRDPLCPLDHLARVRRRMRARSELMVVEEGDHSLLVTKRRLRADGRSQGDVELAIVARVAEFIDGLRN